jgi:myosin heavy subunit
MQKEKIENLSAQQNKVAQKAMNLVDKMNKSTQEKKGLEESVAKNIKDALELPDVKELKNNLRSAKEEIESNRLTDASKSQAKAVEGVQELLEKLEENPREMNQKLAKKLREVQKQLEEMKQEMQTLRKKRDEAQKIKNEDQKKDALRKNNDEMEKLASKMEEMAKTLSRLKNENEGGNLEDSAKELRRIAQDPQENPGVNPEVNPLDKAQEKLQREIQDVQQLAKETEEKLQRERLEKIAESIKLLSERQESLVKESERFDILLNEKGAWTRAQILSLTGFARSQNGLAEETELVASRDLDGLPVFMKTIGMAGRSMRNAAKLSERNSRTQTKGPPLSEKVVPAQKEALQRLMQFQNALKEEISQLASAGKENEPEDKQEKNPDEAKQNQVGGGAQDRKPPSIAQLKLLRNLQAELYDRTEQLSTKFPDSKKMPEDSRREMLNLQKDQREVGELLEILLEFNRKNAPQGDLQ